MSAAVTASQLARSAAAAPGPGWIISQRDDLKWFIGSARAGFGALALMLGGFPVFPLQLIWMLGTVTRTYHHYLYTATDAPKRKGFAFTHHFPDSKLWLMRDNHELAAALRL
jgi:hypothetical protein